MSKSAIESRRSNTLLDWENWKPKLPRGTFVDYRNELYLFLNPSAPTWVFVDEITALLLLLCNGNRTIRDITKIAVEWIPTLNYKDVASRFLSIIQTFFFVEVSDIDAESLRNYKIQGLDIVYIYLTNQCNLCCAYCFKEAGPKYHDELSTQEIHEFLDDITHLTDPSKTTVLFTGGEPLLRTDCFELAEWSSRLGFKVSLNTNGTLINSENVDRFRIFDRVNISIDGSTAELHDKFRGKGTFEIVMRGLSILKERNIKYTLVPTLTKKNYRDSVNILKKLCDGEKTFKTNLFYNAGYGRSKSKELSLEESDLIEFSKSVGKVQKNSVKFVNSEELRPKPFNRQIGCSFGRTYISLDANGDVYPCQIMNDKAFKAGNIRENSIKKIYGESPTFKSSRELTVMSLEQCRSCHIRYLCGGGCRARAFQNTRDIYASDGLCEYWQHRHINAIWATLHPEDKTTRYPVVW